MTSWFASPDDASARLHATGYLADAATATTAYLAGALEKPLLVEGPAGVGKTELAKAVARASGAELVRLQCYEGLDEARALYEWNYKKQLLRIQASKDDDSWDDIHDDVFAEEGLHYVTLHHLVEADGEPELREPGKAEAWSWHAWDALPEPLFPPVAALVASGWRPA